MGYDYTFYYVEANIVCIIIFMIFLLRNIRAIDRQVKQVYFDSVLISHVLYFISDIFWVLILNEKLPKTRITSSIANIFNALILLSLACFWFLYIELTEGETYLEKDRNRFIIALPAIFSSEALVILFVFFPQLMLDKENIPTIWYYLQFIAVPAIYIAVAAIRATQRAFRKENYAVRKQYLICAFYPVAIVIAGIVQMLANKAPIFCFATTIMMLYMYLLNMEDLVSLDPLTGLNNRTQLRRYVSQELHNNAADNFYVIMLDMDHFKNINDTYGHIEGDRAIIKAADTIRRACSGNRIRPFISRYGGDEFILILKTDNENDVLELEEKIRTKFKEVNEKEQKPYQLQTSIGHARFKSEYTAFVAAVNQADKALYLDKSRH